MTFGIGNLVALICIVISIIFAIITHQATNAFGGHCSPSSPCCGGTPGRHGVGHKGQPTLLRSSVFLVIPPRGVLIAATTPV